MKAQVFETIPCKTLKERGVAINNIKRKYGYKVRIYVEDEYIGYEYFDKAN